MSAQDLGGEIKTSVNDNRINDKNVSSIEAIQIHNNMYHLPF